MAKEGKRAASNGDEKGEEIVAKVGTKRKVLEVDMSNSSSPKQKDSSYSNQVAVVTEIEKSSDVKGETKAYSNEKDQDDQLESAKAQMGEVREENQRLRMYLDRIMKDYRTLQMQFNDFAQQDAKMSIDKAITQPGELEEPELVSLSLGRIIPSDSKKDEKNKTSSKGKEDEKFNEDLALGLDYCKFEVSKMSSTETLPNPSPENSFQESKEEAGEAWRPSKIQKPTSNQEDKTSQQNNIVKKARVSIRARCDTPTMNDGCQWRKYGQKIAKGNPCPRAYYRCTVAPSCPVRKQVQRCVDDMSILITTYEGTHNHPLPISATAMASTTSAAASMLLFGSSSSHPGTSTTAATTTTAADLHGLNFYLSNNSKPKQFYFSNTSISSSASCPTVTLDLTSSSSSSSSHFNRLSSSNYPPTSKFSSTNPNFTSESNTPSISWANGHLTYGTQLPYNNNNNYPIGSSFNLGRQTQENFYQSFVHKNTPNFSHQFLSADTVAVATKAITSDPSFQSALVAALTSIIGTNGGANGNISQSPAENFGQKFKWSENFPVVSTFQTTQKDNGCASSYLNQPNSTNSQSGSLMFLPPNSLPFSSSKSASASLVENKDHTN